MAAQLCQKLSAARGHDVTDILLQQRADAGDPMAQIALGQTYESGGNHDMARGWFARAAQAGRAEGLRRLAISLFTRQPLAIRDGMGMIREAAARGDPEAAHLCAVLAAQDQNLPSNLIAARDYLLHAAQLGHAAAQAQVALLAANGVLDLAPWLAHPPFDVVREGPRIRIARGFASPAECDWLVERARERLVPTTIFGRDGKIVRSEGSRDNTEAVFDMAQSDVMLALLRERIARATGFTVPEMDAPTVMHYAPGERFLPHYDFLDPTLPGIRENIALRGQRAATFLLYLDDGADDGGETEFVDLGWRYRGGKGDALLFFNVDAQGQPDRRTRHAGLPPRSGEKWLLSQWLRRR
jgi:prolyl 4-hydroxylase